MAIDESRIKKIIKEYRQGLQRIFNDKLAAVILYGSFARGEGREDSDIDVLCVMRGHFDYSEVIQRSSKLTADLSLKYEVVLSRVFVAEKDFHTRNLPFFMNVRREGIPA